MNGIPDHVNSTLESLDMGGAPPHTDTDWTSRLWAMSKPGQFKTTRFAHALVLSWTWLDSLESLNSLELYASRFRNCALQRTPVRWTLASEPTIWRSLRPCQSRNITEQRIQRLQSRGELSRWRHAAVPAIPRASNREPPKKHELTMWHPKQRTELTRKTKSKHPSCLHQQKASNKLSIPNSDGTGKIDLKAVTKQTQLFVIFFWLAKLWNRKNGILSTFNFVCMCVCIIN